MSEDSFIREVDEELQREQLRKLWNRYGKWVIGSAVAIILVTAGYSGQDYYFSAMAAKSGDKFIQATQMLDDDRSADAMKLLQKLEKDSSGQYPALAGLLFASELARQGKAGQAIEAYDKISTNHSFDSSLRLIARLRAGMLAVDVSNLKEATKRLQPLAEAGLAFRHSAREGLGLANYRAKNLKEALKWFEKIANDFNANPGVRTRANIMLNLLAGRGIHREKAGT